MKKTKIKPILVIAGPGAGKTHDMVDRITEAIPLLEPHRILAAITYTNAAANNIKKRLAKKISIPPNVFIGTNHSFCYRFIFKPFGELIGKLPKELVFMDLDYEAMARDTHGPKRKIKINSLKKNNLAKGRYGYDEILVMSAKIIENSKNARKILCNRLQYLFIDEFQDANNSQLKTFKKIMKEGVTFIYAVGDPEQYIYRFTDTIKSYEKIAINKFKNSAEVKRNKKNYRSCDEIVRFTKQFHCEVDQKSCKGSNENGGVYYISDIDLNSIIKSYHNLTNVLKKNCKTIIKYYLSYTNKTFENVAEEWGLKPVSNESVKRGRLIEEAIKIISSFVGENNKQICERYKLDIIELRKKGLSLVQAVREGRIKTSEDLDYFIKNKLGLKTRQILTQRKVEDKLKKLSGSESLGYMVGEYDMYSSIHKAKGLEADAVLVVAEYKSQLEKWLITDKKARCEEKTDMCRIGYVAFSRAKTILCLACLEKINKDFEKKMEKLGIEIPSGA